MIYTSYFILTGNFENYFYAIFTANKLRTINVGFSLIEPIQAILTQIKINKLLWHSIPLLVLILIFRKSFSRKDYQIIFALLTWFFITLLGISIIFRGVFYHHYFLQVCPQLCIATSIIIIHIAFSETSVNRAHYKHCLIFLALTFVVVNKGSIKNAIKMNVNYIYNRQIKKIQNWGDTPAQISEYLKSKINADDYIYVVDYEPIIYYLTKAKIPTRYSFPPFLISQGGIPNISGVDPIKELEQIVKKKPVYIINRQNQKNQEYYKENKLFFSSLNEALYNSYELDTTICSVNLYRRAVKQKFVYK